MMVYDLQARALWTRLPPPQQAQDEAHWSDAASETGGIWRVALWELGQLWRDILGRK